VIVDDATQDTYTNTEDSRRKVMEYLNLRLPNMLGVPSGFRDSGLGPNSMPWGTGNNYNDSYITRMITSKRRWCRIEAESKRDRKKMK
jgi:hypothetical protein